MKVKYLLALDCEEDGYWDTSGYCHWRKKAFHNREEFDLDDTKGLIKCLASFIEEYPKGDYEIYVIQSYREWNEDEFEWDVNHDHESIIANIKQKASDLAKDIREEKDKKELEKKRVEAKAAQEAQKQRELKLLAELKAKHEHNSSN